MDWSQVSRSQWIVVAGTVATLIGALFLDWYSITVSLGALGHISASTGAWDANALGKLAVIGSLVMLAGVILMFIPNVQLPIALSQALLVAAAFTALMVIFEFIDHHSHTAFGLWLTLIGSLVTVYGAYEMGGRISVPSGSSS
ncbi:MAG TPA: hypothetical protein VN615_12185 [Gaiellales bacterium]|nr:hypothetical protein [Gaiellales bacterium]